MIKGHMIRVPKLSAIEICITVCVILYPIAGLLNVYSSIFSYVDELLMLVTVGHGCIYGMKSIGAKYNPIKKKVHSIGGILLIVFLLTIISNVINLYQRSWYAIAMDALSWMKFGMVFIAAYLSLTDTSINHLYNIFSSFGKFTILWNFALVIANQIFDLRLGNKDLRFGIVPYAIPGTHVAFTVGFFSIVASLLMVEKHINRKWIVAALVICLSTARFKAFGWCSFVIVLNVLIKRKPKILPIIIAVAGVLIVSGDTLATYFLGENVSRGMEMTAALKLAADCFPFGGGFATLGTTMSYQYYSCVYDIYGLSSRYGYMRTAGAFIGDGGWSTQIGQFGYLGAGFFAFATAKICMVILHEKKNFMAGISIVSYLLIASVSERIFSGDLAPFLAIVAVIICRKGCDNKNEIKSER
jgi:hypothetical protein